MSRKWFISVFISFHLLEIISNDEGKVNTLALIIAKRSPTSRMCNNRPQTLDGWMTIRFTRNLISLTISEADFALTRQLPYPTLHSLRQHFPAFESFTFSKPIVEGVLQTFAKPGDPFDTHTQTPRYDPCLKKYNNFSNISKNRSRVLPVFDNLHQIFTHIKRLRDYSCLSHLFKADYQCQGGRVRAYCQCLRCPEMPRKRGDARKFDDIYEKL